MLRAQVFCWSSTPQICEFLSFWFYLILISKMCTLQGLCKFYSIASDSYLSFILHSYISYLPLAHIYERSNQILMLYYGVAIGFYQGVCTYISFIWQLFAFDWVICYRKVISVSWFHLWNQHSWVADCSFSFISLWELLHIYAVTFLLSDAEMVCTHSCRLE